METSTNPTTSTVPPPAPSASSSPDCGCCVRTPLTTEHDRDVYQAGFSHGQDVGRGETTDAFGDGVRSGLRRGLAVAGAYLLAVAWYIGRGA